MKQINLTFRVEFTCHDTNVYCQLHGAHEGHDAIIQEVISNEEHPGRQVLVCLEVTGQGNEENAKKKQRRNYCDVWG